MDFEQVEVRYWKEGSWGGESGGKMFLKWEKRDHITGAGGNLV